jgi:hypothetical protein
MFYSLTKVYCNDSVVIKIILAPRTSGARSGLVHSVEVGEAVEASNVTKQVLQAVS